MTLRPCTLALNLLAAALCCAYCSAAAPPPLAAGFAHPPLSAKPQTWWHWMNGNITKVGIKADLEAMKRAGLGGAMIFNVDCDIPAGPVKFMSPEWLDLVKYAITEANRLGLQMAVHNCAGWSSSGGPWVTPELGMQKVVWTETAVIGPKRFAGHLPAPKSKLGAYHDIATLAFPEPADNDARLENWEGKAGFKRMDNPAPDPRAPLLQDAIIPTGKIQDLSARMDSNGHLSWDVPKGKWLIVRYGYAPIGVHNHPAPPSGEGLECDKLSAQAAEAFWKSALDPILSDIGPLAGKTLTHVLIDSYEVGAQNWTPKFREEFKTRRGYDPVPYLPCISGRIVGSVDVTERFLWDLRLTIADLFEENYFGKFDQMCREHHMRLAVEPYGNGNFDDMRSGAQAGLPMTEFWVGQGPDPSGAKMVASIAHTYGKVVVGAESFTAAPNHGDWQNDPFSLKALGDAMYCGGVNRFIFHRYAMQPWLNRYPGMTMGPWGTHFDRTNTWWDDASAWTTYLARCQYLLQQGQFVGDVCYFAGEGSPHSLPGRNSLTPVLPYGYDYDGCETEILKRMSVKDGRIVLPDGMSYRVLVLPANVTAMTPALLRKVSELARAGAVVVGPRPTHSPSLSDYPKCDDEVKTLAGALWGDCDGKTVTEHTVGKGKVIWGQSMDAILSSLGVAPDFEVTGAVAGAKPEWIHRRTQNADIYFIANWQRRSVYLDCSFRVAGVRPELWRPDTGRIELAPVFMEKGGRISVPLRLDPCGSVFVVFRKANAVSGDHLVAARWKGASVYRPKPGPVSTLKIRKAIYGVLDDHTRTTVNVTAELASLVKNGALMVRADNNLAGDPAPNHVKQLRVVYTYDHQRATAVVNENQTLKLPMDAPKAGATLTIDRALYGVLPPEMHGKRAKPWVDLTDKVARLVKDGRLLLVADNTFAGGDPAPLIRKQFRVDYVLNGEPRTLVVNENAVVEIPGQDLSATPVAQLAETSGGKVTLRPWESGTYEFQTASGKTFKTDVPSVNKPVVVSGPWEVHFQPDRGAPAAATFDRLISWPKDNDPGIKYFSGTATYVKTINVSADTLKAGQAVYLDLGRVKNLARVRVNGHDLGILWKPPFRVEVTSALKPGANTLEIAVTNLWPNRLIGDEQYPDDCQWNPNHSLKAWPEWLLKNLPRPSAKRVTFTTWKYYTKDSPLLESGLLGPVELRAVAVKELNW